MHEISDAAKIITDSVDKEAKIIFGTIKDDKLKRRNKNNGHRFRFSGQRPEKLFQPFGLTKDKEPEKPKPVQEAAPSHPEKSKTKGPIKIEEEDEDWSNIPAFLRRSK